ncbi:uncharacterized protein LOC129003669 [Macrosteles quadrilineatus]|uniref:uncharacterized protein LOC129003669 n=1 Tax=Macrosteles quadrilineatus TaxID=74068 RepID=UPI0023E10C23|nr:uncharacterized protein LOC129003669 [Macrosteles quadrilineatus]
MSLFLKLAAYLNFTWEFIPLKAPGRFGAMLDNGTMVGGVNQAMREGAADITFCNIWQRELSSNNMDFGPPLNMIYVTFIVRRPYMLVDQWQSLLMIFTVHVWLTIAATFLVITLVYWRACHALPLVARKPSLVESAVMMFGILTVSSSYTVPVSLTSRIVSLWCFFFALWLMTAVTSCIVTRLTLPLYSPRINTVQQLVEGGYYWTDPSYSYSNQANKDFFFDLSNKWHNTFENRYEFIPPDEIQSHLLTDRNIALPVQRWGLEHVLLSIPGINSTTDLSSFRVMRGYTQTAFTSFGYRRSSGYNEAFNRIIQQFIEFGLWEYQKHKLTFLRINRKYLLEEKDNHDFGGLQHLSLNNLYPAFVLLVIGHCVALMVLLIELVYCYYLKKLINFWWE